MTIQEQIDAMRQQLDALEKQIQADETPKSPTLGEIACRAFWGDSSECWREVAKAVAEAIIERHLPNAHDTARAIRAEFE